MREYLEGSELCRSPEEPNRDGLVTPSQSDGHLTGKKEGKIEGGREREQEIEKEKEKEKKKKKEWGRRRGKKKGKGRASCEREAISTDGA